MRMLAPRGQAPSLLVNSSNSWVGQPTNKYLFNKCDFIPFSRTRAPQAGLPEHAAARTHAHSTASCPVPQLSRKRGYTGLSLHLGLSRRFPKPLLPAAMGSSPWTGPPARQRQAKPAADTQPKTRRRRRHLWLLPIAFWENLHAHQVKGGRWAGIGRLLAEMEQDENNHKIGYELMV